MWKINSLTINSNPVRQAYYTDGQPLSATRNTDSVSLMVNSIGYLTFQELSSGDGRYKLIVNGGGEYAYYGTASLDITVNLEGVSGKATGTISGDFANGGSSQPLNFPLIPAVYPQAGDSDNLNSMIRDGILPYRSPPAPAVPKSQTELQALADQYLPNVPNNLDMAYAIYDWTTSDFFRFLMFSEMVYTGINGHPIDYPGICQMIWDHYYAPSYSAENADFMNMFMLRPAQSVADIQNQWSVGAAMKLKARVNSEARIMAQAVLSLPKISTADHPVLYRGAMPLNCRAGVSSVSRFGASLMQFWGNAGPADQPLEADLKTVLERLLADGAQIAPKACWSFTNSYDEALQYQNGIVITAHPPAGYAYWPSGGDIKPFSVNPDAVEFNFPQETFYQVNHAEFQTIQNQELLAIDITILGLRNQL